jgi:hypothetical protein
LKKLQSSRRILKEEITEQDVADVVSKWTGIPVSRMLESEADKLNRMEDVLKSELSARMKPSRKLLIRSSDLEPAFLIQIDQSVHSFSLAQPVLVKPSSPKLWQNLCSMMKKL